jgi:hypothetical protein
VSETAEHEAVEKAWKLLNLQADAMLKLAQTQAEPWKVAIGGMAAGGALVGATVALVRLFAL